MQCRAIAFSASVSRLASDVQNSDAVSPRSCLQNQVVQTALRCLHTVHAPLSCA